LVNVTNGSLTGGAAGSSLGPQCPIELVLTYTDDRVEKIRHDGVYPMARFMSGRRANGFSHSAAAMAPISLRTMRPSAIRPKEGIRCCVQIVTKYHPAAL